MIEVPSESESTEPARESVSHGGDVGCQATTPEFPSSNHSATLTGSLDRVEHGRRVAMLLESRTRLLRGNPPAYVVHDPSGDPRWICRNLPRALDLMRSFGLGSTVRYQSGTLLAAMLPVGRNQSAAACDWLAERWDPDLYGVRKESVGTPEIQITAQTAQARLESHERFGDTEIADGRVAPATR